MKLIKIFRRGSHLGDLAEFRYGDIQFLLEEPQDAFYSYRSLFVLVSVGGLVGNFGLSVVEFLFSEDFKEKSLSVDVFRSVPGEQFFRDSFKIVTVAGGVEEQSFVLIVVECE